VRQALIDEGLDRPLFVGPNRGADRRYRLPPAGGAVLVLGDLGCLARDDLTIRTKWEQFGRSLAEAGCRAVALLPLPTTHCPPATRRYWHLLAWEREPGVLDPERWTQQIESLLCLLSPTARVEPGLLRDVRRIAGLEAAAESLVWQHPAVISTSSVAATLDPEDLKRRRAEFKAQPSQVRKQVIERIHAWRARLPLEIYCGEGALLDADSQALLPAGDRELFQRFFVALSDQIRGIGGAVAPRGAEEWFLRFEQRSTKQEPIWGAPAVHRLWEAVHRHDERLTPPPSFKPEGIVSDPDRPVTAVAIRQEGASLVFAPQTQTKPHRGSHLGCVTTRNGLIQVETFATEPDRSAFWRSGQPPPWADDWGTDEYGHWVTFSIQDEQGNKVTQRMRWIAPGSFLMGSRQDEPECFDDEGPQHQVTLSRGFWLFDTAGTQALWQVVMGENWSRFKGADRPVETVSWHDCQRFIERINKRLPGLGLDLPSEAQWEYACRAGTTTPFSFGANITPEQVNYSGNHPYAGGAKGLYRGKTVPVRSLPPNPWGLYEMHGNVWEWTQDHWHDDYQGAPADGLAWEDSRPGAKRVVRGGSWNDHARHVRAAYRYRTHPDDRLGQLGFRCARVQAREPGRQGAEPAQTSAAMRAEAIESRTKKPLSPQERGREEGGQTGRAAGAHPILLRLDSVQPQARCAVPRAPAFLIHTDLPSVASPSPPGPAPSAATATAFGSRLHSILLKESPSPSACAGSRRDGSGWARPRVSRAVGQMKVRNTRSSSRTATGYSIPRARRPSGRQ
jgi:formylglycine-generating enzyme required for sulfatase activity